jgi:hypothetical protein
MPFAAVHCLILLTCLSANHLPFDRRGHGRKKKRPSDPSLDQKDAFVLQKMARATKENAVVLSQITARWGAYTPLDSVLSRTGSSSRQESQAISCSRLPSAPFFSTRHAFAEGLCYSAAIVKGMDDGLPSPFVFPSLGTGCGGCVAAELRLGS